MPTTKPLKLDASLVNDARIVGSSFDRTPSAQIEFWARLGKAAEEVFSGASIKMLKAAVPIRRRGSVCGRPG